MKNGCCVPDFFLAKNTKKCLSCLVKEMLFIKKHGGVKLCFLNQFCGVHMNPESFDESIINEFDGCLQSSLKGSDLSHRLLPIDDEFPPSTGKAPLVRVTEMDTGGRSIFIRRDEDTRRFKSARFDAFSKINREKEKKDDLVHKWNSTSDLTVRKDATCAAVIVKKLDGTAISQSDTAYL